MAAQTGVLIHQLAFLQGEGQLASRSAAAFAVTATTIGSVVARLIVGHFADRTDKVRLTVIFIAIQACVIATYTFTHSTSVCIWPQPCSASRSATSTCCTPCTTGEIFGLVSYGSIYGVMSLAGSLGSAAGLFFTGWALDWSGGYDAVPRAGGREWPGRHRRFAGASRVP